MQRQTRAGQQNQCQRDLRRHQNGLQMRASAAACGAPSLLQRLTLVHARAAQARRASGRDPGKQRDDECETEHRQVDLHQRVGGLDRQAR